MFYVLNTVGWEDKVASDNVCFNLKEGFQYWRRSRDQEMQDTDHISDRQLHLLSGVEGLRGVSTAIVNHLSMCPQCLNRWVRSCAQMREADAAQQSSDDYLIYGVLEAAASLHTVEPVQTKSSCGKISLGIFPASDDTVDALVTLEVISDDVTFLEGKVLTVREKSGTIILDGCLQGGRLGGTCSDIRKIDLSAWTMQVS